MTKRLSNISTARKPRLLMLTHRFPFPLDRGDRIRAYNILRFLANKYSITLAAVSDESIENERLQHLDSICENVLVGRCNTLTKLHGALYSLRRSASLTEGMFRSPQLAKELVERHQRKPFDAIIVYCSSMFQYVDHAAFQGIDMLVDLVDVDSEKWKQMSQESGFPKSIIYSREARLVRQLEQRIANRSDSVTLVSDEESQLFERSVSVPAGTKVQGVGNGVDAEYFSPNAVLRTLEQPARNGLSLVFTGVLDYHPNVAGVDWFCRHVLPLVHDRLNVTFKIVGRSPSAKIRALVTLPGVELIGSVPDVRPYLAAANVVISPLKLARGIQNKVLEAMAMQRPVICTTPSAEGIDAEHGTHFLIADTVEQWSSELCRLSEDLQLRAKLAGAARERVVEHYSWPARLQPILNLLPQPSSPVPTLEPACV